MEYCPHLVFGSGGDACSAEVIILQSLSGRAAEGGVVFYQGKEDRGNCKGIFPNCNTFKYVKGLK